MDMGHRCACLQSRSSYKVMVEDLAGVMVLGALLQKLASEQGGYELVDHWQQGEFHHDVVLKLARGDVLVVATNCNGGIKEVLRFDTVPDRWALWHHRCPTNPEFAGEAHPHPRAGRHRPLVRSLRSPDQRHPQRDAPGASPEDARRRLVQPLILA